MPADLTGDVPGATPLEPEDLEGLIPDYITTCGELNEVKQDNIVDALLWARGRRWTVLDVADAVNLRRLHKRMFGQVWTWAGDWRTRMTNIGVMPYEIAASVHQMAGDVRAQVADADRLAWPAPELLARFHHRLVLIHPFRNGNGRHARLATDLLATAIGHPRSLWGGTSLGEPGDTRQTYLKALRTADATADMEPLLDFMWPDGL